MLEAIVAWNQRVTGGETPTSWPADEFASGLPLIALTCIDPRLNAHFPNGLGLRDEQFIWLRNAGNVITGTTSSTMRSLALACAVKGGREIVIIGHTDCGVRRTTVTDLTDRLRAVGVPRDRLPEDIVGFFGLFASERQNVIQGADCIRRSPLIGAGIPVHGLLIDVQSGRLEWVVNGYESWSSVMPVPEPAPAAMPDAEPSHGTPPALPAPPVSLRKFKRPARPSGSSR